MLIKKCEFCKKKKLFVKERKVTVPQIGIEMKSAKKMCGSCFNKLKKYFIKPHEKKR